MPTKHPRIPVTKDRELTDALDRVLPYFDGAPLARVVHDLAIRGAETLEHEQEANAAALERLIALSTGRIEGIDWAVLERIDELAWSD